MRSDVLARLSPASAGASRLPVIGLTRRGDLKAKLSAFEGGVRGSKTRLEPRVDFALFDVSLKPTNEEHV